MAAIFLIWGGPGLAKTSASDQGITQAVEIDFFADDIVDPNWIDVETSDGIITLSGTADHILAKDRAVTIAKTIKGVRVVIDKLNVRPTERPDMDIKKDIVRSLLDDPATDSFDLNVEVSKGVVALDGEVDSWVEKQLAEKIAKGIRGVVEVRNEIRFRPQAKRSDQDIEADIEKRLGMDIWLHGNLIDVNVKEGKVTLSGKVGSAFEKSRAEWMAWISGVQSVDPHNLEVDSRVQDQMRRYGDPELEDDEIAEAIQDAFSLDPRLKDGGLTVTVDGGVATIEGVVNNLAQKRAATNVANHSSGVSRVFNLVKVRPPDSLNDEQIQANVLSALMADPVVHGANVTVSSRDGKVYLHGYVGTTEGRLRAERIADRQQGVITVVNKLAIDAWSGKSDWEIREGIRDQLFWSPFVSEEDIQLAVQDGVVTIKGKVNRRSELEAAIENAFEGGARKVVNHLALVDDEFPEEFKYYRPQWTQYGYYYGPYYGALP